MFSSKPSNSISPPSSWTEGRIFSSSSSLIIATTSLSVSNISVSLTTSWSNTQGSPLATWSRIVENSRVLRIRQVSSFFFVMVKKSRPRNTLLTPSVSMIFLTRGERRMALRSPTSKCCSRTIENPLREVQYRTLQFNNNNSTTRLRQK